VGSPQALSTGIDMRTQVLEAATHLFGKHGFAGTSVQMVAEAVGIRKQSLLYYFSSKQRLRDEVLESLLAFWKDVVPPALAEAASKEGRLESALRVLIDFFVQDRSRASLLVRELLDRPKETSAAIHRHLAPWQGLIIDYIKKGQARGEVQPDLDPQMYLVQVVIQAISLVASVNVVHFMLEEESKEKTLRRLLEEYFRSARASLFTLREQGQEEPPLPRTLENPDGQLL